MRAFTDYEYYKEAYGGELSKAEYEKKSKTAYTEIVHQTSWAAVNAPEIMEDRIKMCECSLIDALAEIDETASVSGVISSVSNDGYAIHYANTKGTNRQEIISLAAKDLCFKYLTEPINLMCRWM